MSTHFSPPPDLPIVSEDWNSTPTSIQIVLLMLYKQLNRRNLAEDKIDLHKDANDLPISDVDITFVAQDERELDATVPLRFTHEQVIQALINEGFIVNQPNVHFDLAMKGGGVIQSSQTLQEAGVKDGDRIRVVATHRAGGAPNIGGHVETETSSEDDKTAITAYYSRVAFVQKRYETLIYLHISSLTQLIASDVRNFASGFGGEIPVPRVSKQSLRIKPGTQVTVVPECDQLDFEPKSLTKTWYGEWVRFNFDWRADHSLAGETVVCRISVQIEGIEVASIQNCAIELLAVPTDTKVNMSPTNPLARAELTTASANLYNKIFVSYSRKDMEVVHAYRVNQIARGDDVFVDTEGIRSGEDWQSALAKAIREADIFQLFWSENSANSDNVRAEWDFALSQRCGDDKCRGFIRPVFWQKPMPNPPSELSHLNFRYVTLGERTEAPAPQMPEN